MHSSSPVRIPKFQLIVEKPSVKECWIPPKKKKISHVQGQRRSCNKMVGGPKSCLESNARVAQRAKTKPCVHQDPGTPQETDPDSPLRFWVSPVEACVSNRLPWGQGLWLQQTWEAQCVSPGIEPQSKQSTCWKTIIPKKFSHCCEISETYNRYPNLGSPQMD